MTETACQTGKIMFHLFRYTNNLAIDLGTANTLVYVPSRGIVLNEPSMIAFDIRNDKILAIGQDAKTMEGKTPPHIVIMRPMKDGVIADFKMTRAMLQYFIRKAAKRFRFLSPQVVIAVPVGITEVRARFGSTSRSKQSDDYFGTYRGSVGGGFTDSGTDRQYGCGYWRRNYRCCCYWDERNYFWLLH